METTDAHIVIPGEAYEYTYIRLPCTALQACETLNLVGKWWQVGAPRPLEDDQLLEDNIEYEFVPLTTAEFGFMVNRLDRSLQREKAITNIIGSFAVAGWVLGAVAIGLQNEYFFAAGAVGSLSGVLAVVWLALRKFRERRHAQAFFDLICAGLGIH